MWVTEGNILPPLQPPFRRQKRAVHETISIESKGMHGIRWFLKHDVLYFSIVFFCSICPVHHSYRLFSDKRGVLPCPAPPRPAVILSKLCCLVNFSFILLISRLNKNSSSIYIHLYFFFYLSLPIHREAFLVIYYWYSYTTDTGQ